jgi:DNA-binding response OmpR family regulator
VQLTLKNLQHCVAGFFYLCEIQHLIAEMKLFVIDWSKDCTTPLLEVCSTCGHEIVGREMQDGAEAYKKTGTAKPDAIVVNYAVKPSHGRMTAESIRGRKGTSQIPIYFIDGEEEDNEKVANLGLCLSGEELRDLLTNEQ